MPPTPTAQLPELIHRVEFETGDGDPLSQLAAASALARELTELGDAVLGYFVDQARHAGHSWSEIGGALGVTKQAAQQRHDVRQPLDPWGLAFQRFTPRAHKVLVLAESVAREHGQDYIGTEHVLLALFREPAGVAAKVLVRAGVSSADVEADVDRRIPRGAGSPGDRLTFTRRANAIYAAALAAAMEMDHDYVGTEHLLVGLAHGDGVAAAILTERGLTPTPLTDLVRDELQREVDGAERASSPNLSRSPRATKRPPAKPRKRPAH